MQKSFFGSSSSYANSGSKFSDQSDLFSDLDSPVKGEIALWRAVITQALIDAGSNSVKREMIYERNQAISWLTNKSKDFIEVCELAQLDPSIIREKAVEAIKQGCIWRKESVKLSKKAKRGSKTAEEKYNELRANKLKRLAS